ncbi:hypothetical protein niasHT_038987 [Heterodera trifolii]|uniref:Uncharacterized protein n=1 Tax=Heterodera trifolii TaxID=157864 RepID=A0ABD2I4C5_9BILA
MRSRRDYVAPQHRSARDHTSAPRVEQMTGFYTENAQLRARAGPNWLLVRVARDRHRPSARANTDPKTIAQFTQSKQHSPDPGTRPRKAGLKTELTQLLRASQRTPPANAPFATEQKDSQPQSGG